MPTTALPPVAVPLRRRVRTTGLTVLGLYGPFCAWQAWCLTGLGGWQTRGAELFVVLALGAGVLLIAAAFPLVLFARAHERAVTCSTTGAAVLLAFVPAMWLGGAARMLAFRLAGERCAPLIAAIERCIADTGEPPATLADLVPRWLDRLPRRIPDLRIETGDDRFGNPWILAASTPSGLINFDGFYYFPNQNYPAHAWGGRWQRLGRWAYLHE